MAAPQLRQTAFHEQTRRGRAGDEGRPGPGRPAPASPDPGSGPGPDRETEWHRLTAQEVLQRLGTGPERGLTATEAARRLAEAGPNLLPDRGGTPLWAVLAGQFRDFMVLVLLAATAVSYLLGEVADAVAIAAIVFLNAVLGAAQEFRAERSLAALKRLTAPRARVWRDGSPAEIPAADVVPGDILLLSSGDRVAADARLLEVVALEAEESALTGESLPVTKGTEALPGPAASLGDRRNMVFQGTVVTRGHGRAAVVATGRHTEMGGIASLMEEAGQEPTPLQRRLEQLGRYLIAACLLVSALVAVGGLLRGEAPYQMLLTGVSLAVAAIPEGLPAVVTIVLALGVQRMLRKNAVIRRLPAVETLGCATVICSDKTGTMTKNEMTVRAAWTGGAAFEVTGEGYRPEGEFRRTGPFTALPAARHDLELLLQAAALCGNARLMAAGRAARGEVARQKQARLKGQAAWSVDGDPTEGALVVAAAKAGITQEGLAARFKRVGEIPFESDRQRMTVICRGEGGRLFAFIKGAPERVLGLCNRLRSDGRDRALGPGEERQVLAEAAAMAGGALRVLGVAMREIPAARAALLAAADWPAGEVEEGLVFLGLLGMMDPPRREVGPAVRRCQEAGLRVVMVTGDHAATARAVATELGLQGQVITGAELAALDDSQLEKAAAGAGVFARVSPADKLRIVRALQHAGQVVAMTGDGVNDAPALKEADIGIAMGQKGAEVTKEAGAMVLADDNFATIVAALEEGRGIYANIRKFIRYLLACNTGEVLVMFLATMAGLPLPLLPIQILLVNLVTDGLPAIALGIDPPQTGLMSRPPRDPGEGVFSGGLWQKILGRGTLIGLATLTSFAASLATDLDLPRAQTTAMAVLSLAQLFYAFECRSEEGIGLASALRGNPALLAAVGSSLLALVAAVHLPALQALFHTVPLSAGQWAWAAAFALSTTLASWFARWPRRPSPARRPVL